MKVIVKKDYEQMCGIAADIIAGGIRKKPDTVLGLATGSTPLGVYKELIRLHRDEGLDFSRVITFNLDEYIGLKAGHSQSYDYFMRENLFNDINIKPANIHIPDGMAGDISGFCREYEEKIKTAGGIDIQLLGIGSNGHIAFNEPGSPQDSRTRRIEITRNTIRDNSRFFNDNEKEVPESAISMGLGTIMDSKQIVLCASGANKAKAVAGMLEGPVTTRIPASIINNHPKAIVVLDEQAASELTGDYL